MAEAGTSTENRGDVIFDSLPLIGALQSDDWRTGGKEDEFPAPANDSAKRIEGKCDQQKREWKSGWRKSWKCLERLQSVAMRERTSASPRKDYKKMM